MPKRSNEFQKLVYIVKQQVAAGAQVTESKMLTDLQTGDEREVDICIESAVAGHPVRVCVECTDLTRVAALPWVEQLKAKHERLGTNVLVLVSRSGYSRRAIRLAQRSGIHAIRFEDFTNDSARVLFGDCGSVWAKLFALRPTKVLMSVAATPDLPVEAVSVYQNTDLYSEAAVLLGSAADLVTDLLDAEATVKGLGQQGTAEHKGFELRWDAPQLSDGKRIYLQKIEPRVLRPIEYVRVLGVCEFRIAELPLRHGVLDKMEVAWGVGTVDGGTAMFVASRAETGEPRMSLHLDGIRVDPRAKDPAADG